MDSLSLSMTESIKKMEQSYNSVNIKLSAEELGQLSDQVVSRVVPVLSTKISENLVVLNENVENLSSKTDKIDQGLGKTANEVQDLRNSLVGLPKLVTTLQGILDNPKTSINIGNKTSPTLTNSPQNPTSDKPRKRNAVVFTSSLALGTAVEKLQFELNADVKIHATYFIENNTNLTEKGAYLNLKINEEMDNTVDFVIVQVGSNEMSQLDLKEEKKVIFEKMQHDCDCLVKLAKHMVEEYDVDVYLSEKPPRYEDF